MSSKGANWERSLKKMFESRGFAVVRSAGSGVDHSSPDLLALSSTRRIAIECKAWNSGYLWIEKERFAIMADFERKTAIPYYVAWKVSRQEWRFFPLSALKETGKAFTASEKDLHAGITFDVLLG
ncbi:MAG: Holliday junction resolvase Hjc [Candidatus Micrarchaeota archaeon]